MEEEESKAPFKDQPSLNLDQVLLSSPERTTSVKNEYSSNERPKNT
jgi:hypothetical protein